MTTEYEPPTITEITREEAEQLQVTYSDPAEHWPDDETADLDAIDSGEHVFVPAVGDPGHCAICGEYDSDHEPTDEDIFRGER